mmetsp:Transcript_30415/g.62699  ORF Transcript_30415/g.62699 Transcript_30415/m.62699 type:complete len:261 (-) Transcript_30415:859-1641(-)
MCAMCWLLPSRSHRPLLPVPIASASSLLTRLQLLSSLRLRDCCHSSVLGIPTGRLQGQGLCGVRCAWGDCRRAGCRRWCCWCCSVQPCQCFHTLQQRHARSKTAPPPKRQPLSPNLSPNLSLFLSESFRISPALPLFVAQHRQSHRPRNRNLTSPVYTQQQSDAPARESGRATASVRHSASQGHASGRETQPLRQSMIGTPTIPKTTFQSCFDGLSIPGALSFGIGIGPLLSPSPMPSGSGSGSGSNTDEPEDIQRVARE